MSVSASLKKSYKHRYRCELLLQTLWRGLSDSVEYNRELCKSGWTDRDVV